MTPLSHEQFQEKFQSSDFVLKTQAQIAKDFNRLGYSPPPSLYETPLSLNDLLECVQGLLSQVMQLGETSTLQLLYIIDVPQSDFLSITADPNFLHKASFLIVKREAQKVHFRSFF